MRAGLVAISLAVALGLGVGYGAAAGNAESPSPQPVASRPAPWPEVPITSDLPTPSATPTKVSTPAAPVVRLPAKPTVDPRHNDSLDERCLAGRVLCVDKTTRELSWVIDGVLQRRLDVRFGSEFTPTREGVFSVYRMSANHVSNLYGSSMPYAMFFSRGQAVHYSSDFATRGYAGASHGCVNVRDKGALAALFAQVRVGDTVVVHRS